LYAKLQISGEICSHNKNKEKLATCTELLEVLPHNPLPSSGTLLQTILGEGPSMLNEIQILHNKPIEQTTLSVKEDYVDLVTYCEWTTSAFHSKQEANIAALDRLEWRRCVAQYVHMDVG